MGQAFSNYTEISHSVVLEHTGSRLSHVFSSAEYIDASRWCITREDLDFFESEVRNLWKAGKIPEDPKYPNPHHWDPQVGPNIHQVTIHYIVPATGNGVSWALKRHPEGLECDVFASHCWSEGVFEFITAVRQAWPPDVHHLYCCFLSNPQGEAYMVEEILGSDIRQSPFHRALRTAKVLLVIPNKNVSIYCRLRCVYEAYIAIRTGLQVRLPQQVPRGKLVVFIFLCFLVFLCSAYIGLRFLSPAFGNLLGPLTWLIFAQVLADIGKFMRDSTTHLLSFSWIAWTAFRMVIIGQCVGLSLAKCVGLSKGSMFAGTHSHDYSQDEGSTIAVLFITAALVCEYLYDMFVAMRHVAVTREGFQLDFSTVEDAGCSSEADKKRIMEEIQYDVQDIDQAIFTLRRIGRYDREVQRDLEFGLPAWLLRDGINPFRAVLAVLTWQYWWLFDLWDNHLFTLTFEVPVLSCFLFCSLVHVIGERASFVIDSLLVGGMAFDSVTAFMSCRSQTGERAFENGHRALRSWIHSSGLLMVFLANVLHYRRCGFRKYKTVRSGRPSEVTPHDHAIQLVYSSPWLA